MMSSSLPFARSSNGNENESCLRRKKTELQLITRGQEMLTCTAQGRSQEGVVRCPGTPPPPKDQYKS